jgi:sugar phosphate isomerase/epimerase
MKRRGFMKNSLLAGGLSTASMSKMETKSSLKTIGMATNWGWTDSLDAFATKAKSLGYDGFEMWFPADPAKQEEIKKVLDKHQLQIGFLVGSGKTDSKTHFTEFESLLKGSLGFSQKPLYINCHSGKDYFSFEENAKIVELSINQSEKTGIKIGHETHRGRMCFAANITRVFLEKYPLMKLTLDISHWTNVHESLLADQKDSVKLALERTIHVHTRVGHQEGPQVNDPRAPEWAEQLKAHLSWWDEVVRNMENRGEKTFTFLTEFGPPAYLPTVPFTNMPLANQWDINKYMLNMIKERYAG